jgi:alpha-tubulin suppressor-like RCC1 family protein
LTADKTPVCWGWYGGTTSSNFDPQWVEASFVKKTALKGVLMTAATEGNLCVLNADGTVSCMGSYGSGNGDGTGNSTQTMVQVQDDTPAPLTGVASIVAGHRHNCAIKTNGEVWCWGQGNVGQLGTGTSNSNSAIKATFPMGTVIKQVSLFGRGGCALDSTNQVWVWGNDGGSHGRWGDTTSGGTKTPTQVPSLTNVVSVSCNGGHLCALKDDKTVYCWGKNQAGQTGNGDSSVDPVTAPTKVKASATDDLSDVEEVVTGTRSTCVRKTDKTLWCWGENKKGVLGINTTTDALYPTQVVTADGMPLTNATAISAGKRHYCAMVGAGARAYCWGNNHKSPAGIPRLSANVALPTSACSY